MKQDQFEKQLLAHNARTAIWRYRAAREEYEKAEDRLRRAEAEVESAKDARHDASLTATRANTAMYEALTECDDQILSDLIGPKGGVR